MLNTPVLFLIFNRPDTTAQVFEAIRLAKPKQLFVAADGPRKGISADIEKCKAARELIKIDWDCEVKTLFRDENLGCGLGPASAITWFFENVEQGIILEDDCLPNQSFFRFCEELLNYYKDNERIMLVSGNNFGFKQLFYSPSYYFSSYTLTWGWATWKRAWQQHDYYLNGLDSFIENRKIESIFKKTQIQEHWVNEFVNLKNNFKNDIWDTQWLFTIFNNNGLSIIPRVNLVSNIGHNIEGTHTLNPNEKISNYPSKELIQIIHRKDVLKSERLDIFITFNQFITQYSFVSNLKKVVYRSLKRLTIKIPHFRIVYRDLEMLKQQKKQISKELAEKILNEELMPMLLPQNKTQKNKNLADKKTILHVNTTDLGGGAAKIAWQLNELFRSESTDSILLVKEKKSKSDHVFEIPRIYPSLQEALDKYSEKKGLIDIYQLSSVKILETENFKQSDIVHFHNLHGYYFTPFLIPEIARRKRIIWTLHDMQSFTGHCAYSFDCTKWLEGCIICPYLSIYPELKTQNSNYLWTLKKQIYEASEIDIVCPSKWLYNLAKGSILKSQRIHLIYNGIDTTIFKPTNKEEARKKLNLPVDKKILLFSANFGIENSFKGGKYILEVCKHYKKRTDLLFVNIGAETFSENGNILNIEYINNQSDVALYYSASDLFVYPSLADNCPLVVLESLACGTPVISFDTGGIPELIEHLQSGYVAQYKDTWDFIHGIELFLNNSKLYESAVKYGIKTVNDSFTIEKMVENYMKLYKSIA